MDSEAVQKLVSLVDETRTSLDAVQPNDLDLQKALFDASTSLLRVKVEAIRILFK